MKIKFWVVVIFSLFVSAIGVEKYASSKIVSGVERALPKAKGVSASFPLSDLPVNIISNSIKSANIKIESYKLSASATDVSLRISAADISKSKPTLVRSLDVTATIPESTITNSPVFESAQIVGNALQVSLGSAGLGEALLVPKFSDNKLFFELKSFSLFGNEIPSSSLPREIQEQIKSQSSQSFSLPKGLKVVSVSLSSKGLSFKLHGDNVRLGNLGSVF
jgi:hypothetical protein